MADIFGLYIITWVIPEGWTPHHYVIYIFGADNRLTTFSGTEKFVITQLATGKNHIAVYAVDEHNHFSRQVAVDYIIAD